ncbi:MAG TPA: hypothetical protein VFJ90_11345, partial [Candidatus Didemnitutus sp.]|nr:hypothetical protein [Candidatus Didemnitutus sp.]
QPEFVTAAPFGSSVADRHAVKETKARSSLERLAARIHRCAVAPQGYRYIANIAASSLSQAMLAVKYTAGTEDLLLITPAVDDAGNPVDDIAVYANDELPDPTAFWAMFHSGREGNAA